MFVRLSRMFPWHQEPMIHLTSMEVEEIDRVARAYGFEIGRGQQIAEIIEVGEDNPFLKQDWRDRIKIGEPK